MLVEFCYYFGVGERTEFLGNDQLLRHFVRCRSTTWWKSVHNQSIEQLWRDVFEGVLGFYHRLFKHLELIGELDPDDDDIHLFSLHYCLHSTNQQTLRSKARCMD